MLRVILVFAIGLTIANANTFKIVELERENENLRVKMVDLEQNSFSVIDDDGVLTLKLMELLLSKEIYPRLKGKTPTERRVVWNELKDIKPANSKLLTETYKTLVAITHERLDSMEREFGSQVTQLTAEGKPTRVLRKMLDKLRVARQELQPLRDKLLTKKGEFTYADFAIVSPWIREYQGTRGYRVINHAGEEDFYNLMSKRDHSTSASQLGPLITRSDFPYAFPTGEMAQFEGSLEAFTEVFKELKQPVFMSKDGRPVQVQ